MTDPFIEHMALTRASYLDHFRATIAGLREQGSLALEVLVRPNGRIQSEPLCLMRVDAMIPADDGPPRLLRIAERPAAEEERLLRRPNGLEIAVLAFSWEALEVRFPTAHFNIDALASWMRVWLDPDERRERDADGLAGAIHDLAWDRNEDDQLWTLGIDLGTAPITALEELLDALVAAGVERITVSQHDS